MLRKLVKSGETRPFAAADMALLLRVRFALQEFETGFSEIRAENTNGNQSLISLLTSKKSLQCSNL
jgi:hypothetical protein